MQGRRLQADVRARHEAASSPGLLGLGFFDAKWGCERVCVQGFVIKDFEKGVCGGRVW